MPAKYKLTYFNFRGLAELIRLILAQAGADYEDVRIERENWPELKPKMPFSKLPVLEVKKNGKIISESRAIARYVARQHGLTGKDDLEAARCDMLVDALYDVQTEMKPFLLENDEAKKAELKKKFLAEVMPPALECVEKMLAANNGGKGYIIGSKVTWADIALANFLSTSKKFFPNFLDGHKLLESFCDRILNLPKIKKWIETRPDTIF